MTMATRSRRPKFLPNPEQGESTFIGKVLRDEAIGGAAHGLSRRKQRRKGCSGQEVRERPVEGLEAEPEARGLDGVRAKVLPAGQRGPRAGASLWSSGFLPTVYSGVRFRNQGDPIPHPNWRPGALWKRRGGPRR